MERPKETNPPSAVNRLPDEDAESSLGGADAVEKTTSLSDVHGAGVNDAEQWPVGLTANVPHRASPGPIVWILIVLVALVLVAYAAGLFT